ncbi:MAG TPA: glycosyltransferase [Pyrinomonadaceae bacterium]|nr:glycosyltransferase [Pyrinomonadaceae bacterium]
MIGTQPQSDKTAPTASIVIAAYNASAFIQQTLDSVLAQTFTDYETIVVNDGSVDTPELERILESHPLPIVYISQQNKGVSAARNAGIKVAKGKFYAQLDSDDQWEPDYLAVQVRFLTERPDIGLVYPNAIIFGDSSDVGLEYMKICPSEGEVSFESLIEERCIVLTCVTARMSVIKSVGMFDEALRSCEDFDLWLRIIKNGGRISYHRQVLARYRRHLGSLSSDRVWMTSNLLAVMEKTAKRSDLTDSEREILSKQLALRQTSLQLFQGKHALALGDATVALKRLEEANRSLRSLKLSLTILLLRYWPRLPIWAFAARERFLARRQEHLLSGIDTPRGMAS